ncbi:MAG: hypothetical protein JXA94_00540 [Parachlamydiales bacterium]|nr:hypothetical protein [Parachlamydiales bacterium]
MGGFKATKLYVNDAALLGVRQVTDVPLSGWRRNADSKEGESDNVNMGFTLFGAYKDTKNTSTRKYWEFKVQIPLKTEIGTEIIIIRIEQRYDSKNSKSNYLDALKDLGYFLQGKKISRIITAGDSVTIHSIDEKGRVKIKKAEELPRKFLSTIRELNKMAISDNLFPDSTASSFESTLKLKNSFNYDIRSMRQDIESLKDQREKLEEKAIEAKEKRKRELDEKLQDKDTGYQKIPALWWEKITGLSDPEKKLAILKGRNRLPREFDMARFGTFKTIPKYLSRKPFTLDELSERLEKAKTEYEEALRDLEDLKPRYNELHDSFSELNRLILPKIIKLDDKLFDQNTLMDTKETEIEEKRKEIQEIEKIPEANRSKTQMEELEKSQKEATKLEKELTEIQEEVDKILSEQKKLEDRINAKSSEINVFDREIALKRIKRVQKAQAELKTIEARVEHLKSAINT